MMSPATRTASADHGKRSPSRGANVTRIASAAVGHAAMMTISVWRPLRRPRR
jgi:hypothetical protein